MQIQLQQTKMLIPPELPQVPIKMTLPSSPFQTTSLDKKLLKVKYFLNFIKKNLDILPHYRPFISTFLLQSSSRKYPHAAH